MTPFKRYCRPGDTRQPEFSSRGNENVFRRCW